MKDKHQVKLGGPFIFFLLTSQPNLLPLCCRIIPIWTHTHTHTHETLLCLLALPHFQFSYVLVSFLLLYAWAWIPLAISAFWILWTNCPFFETLFRPSQSGEVPPTPCPHTPIPSHSSLGRSFSQCFCNFSGLNGLQLIHFCNSLPYLDLTWSLASFFFFFNLWSR